MNIRNRKRIMLLWIVAAVYLPFPAFAVQQSGIEAAFKDKNISSSNPVERAEVWLSVWNSATVDDAEVLKQVATSGKSSHARRVAVETMGKLNRPDLFLDCIHEILLNDKSTHVRRAAAYSLGLIASSDSLEPLNTTLLRDSDANVRKRAAASIARTDNANAKTLLQNALAKEKDETVRVAIEWCVQYPNGESRLPSIQRGKVTDGICNGTRYGLYVPSSYRKNRQMEVLVSVHGSDGTPEKYLNICIKDAENYGFIVVAPWFDFPTFDHYGTWSTRHLGMPRADLRLLEILDDVGKTLNIQKEKFNLYGHSQGGQFVHRFALAYPDRVNRVAAAAPGSVIIPDVELGFPNGVGFNPLFPDLDKLNFRDFATAEIAMVVGEKDTTRIQHTNQLVKNAKEFASKNKTESKVQFILVPNHGHGGGNNYKASRAFFFQH